MKREGNQSIKLSQSLKEWLYDYLIILVVLAAAFIIMAVIYRIVLAEVPNLNEVQSNLISFTTTVLPTVILFTYMDYRGGSLGKKRAGLALNYKHKTIKAALIRNIVKFTPWQLAHIGVISGVFTDFQSIRSQVLSWLSVILLILLLSMRIFRQDGRHIGDILAGTQVVANPIA